MKNRGRRGISCVHSAFYHAATKNSTARRIKIWGHGNCEKTSLICYARIISQNPTKTKYQKNLLCVAKTETPSSPFPRYINKLLGDLYSAYSRLKKGYNPAGQNTRRDGRLSSLQYAW
jgi:hypothetical protein